MLLIISEIQIKTTMSYHLILVRMGIIKDSTNNKWWKGCGEGEHLYTIGGNIIGVAAMQNSMKGKKLK